MMEEKQTSDTAASNEADEIVSPDKQDAKIANAKITDDEPQSSGLQNPSLHDKQPEEPYFQFNRKYSIISMYVLLVLTIGTVIIYLIINMPETKAGLSNLLSVLSPFLGAIFIAFLLNPVVVFLDQKIFRRLFGTKLRSLRQFLSIFLAYVFAFGIITIGVVYVIPQLGQSLTELTPTVLAIINTVTHFLENIEDIYPELDMTWIENKINEITPNLISFGTNFLTNLVPFVYSVSISIAKLVVNILLSIVVSCYMLTDKTILARNGKRIAYALLPESKVKGFIRTAKECLNIFTGFIVGKTIDSLIIGVLCFIIMSILKMPYALLLSVIVGVTNMIPYFGPFIGAVPGVVIYLFLSPLQALGFAVMILAIQQFDGLILGPRILGSSTGLKPLWVVFAITIGGAYGGVLGMFLGVPVVAVIFHLANKFLKGRLKAKQIEDNF